MRGREVSRIEGFSDAVFGFVLTLLVVSLEVPQDYADLRQTLVGFPAFAATFAIVVWIWYEHYAFFRKFALQDGLTVFLNSILLFTVMFFAYPLKFVATRLISGTILGQGPTAGDGATAADARLVMTAYSAGFVAVFAVFALLHWNAWRRRDPLQLTPLEVFDARSGVRTHLLTVLVGLVSITIAVALPIRWLGAAGLLFFVLGPIHFTNGYMIGRKRAQLEAAR